MAVDESTQACDELHIELAPTPTTKATRAPDQDDEIVAVADGKGGEASSEPKRKQPIGAAAAPHMSTFLGAARNVNNNNDNSNREKLATTNNKSHHHHHHLQHHHHFNHLHSQSQTPINHSLESINSRYSTSSANDDSAHSMQHNSDNNNNNNHRNTANNQQQQPAKESALLHRLSSSQASNNCSPIEAQLASSTCDLGIKLTPEVWRGSFSGAEGRRISALIGGGGSLATIVADGGAGAEKPPRMKTVVGRDTGDPENGADLSDEVAAAAAEEASGPPKAPFMFAGVLASLVGSVFFSLSVLCIKLLPNQEGFSEKVKALCFRGIFVTVLCGIAIIVQRSTIIVRREELLVNILRAVFGTCGVLGLYSALSYISMGDATALIFSSPVWTSILSHFILGEPLQWLQLIALPASLFGIVLIAHPGLIVDVEPLSSSLLAAGPDSNDTLATTTTTTTTTTAATLAAGNSTTIGHHMEPRTPLEAVHPSFDFEHRWPGIVIALATSLLVSCVYIALKFRKKTPIQTTTFWFGFFMIIAALALQCITGPIDIPLTLYEWSLLFGNGVTSWLGQSFLQWAFLYEEAGVLSVVRTLDVAMTFALSALFLGEEILWTSVVGATIIGLVVVSIMLNEWIRKVTRASKPQPTLTAKTTTTTAAKVGSGQLSKSAAAAAKELPDERNTRQSAYIIASKA